MLCFSKISQIICVWFQLNGAQITPTLSFSSGHAGNIARKNEAWLRIEKAGIYKVLVTHDSVTINNDLVLLVLTGDYFHILKHKLMLGNCVTLQKPILLLK